MPPVYAADDPADELDLVRRAEADWQTAQRRAAAWDDNTVATLEGWARQSPWMEADAMLSLAEGGITYDTPAGQAALQAAGADYFQGWRGGREPGEQPVMRPRRSFFGRVKDASEVNGKNERLALADPAVKAALQPSLVEHVLAGDGSAEEIMAQVGDAATWEQIADAHNRTIELRGMLRDEFGDRWVDQQLGDYAEVTNMAARASGLEDTPDEARPDWMSDDQWGAVEDFRGGGDFPDDPQVVQWLGVQDTRDPSAGSEVPAESVQAVAEGRYDPAVHGNLGSLRPDAPIGGPEALTRAALMVVNAPIQEVTGMFRQTVSGVRRQGWLGYLRGGLTTPGGAPQSQSDLGIVAGQLLRGEEVDTGSGFFVSPTSGVGQERLRREQQYGAIDGQVITPGRWAVDAFTGLDAGDTGYGAASGLVDFAFQVGADPLNAVGATMRSQRAARAAFSGAGSLGDEVIETTARATGELVDDVVQAPVEAGPVVSRVAQARLGAARQVPDAVRREEAVGLLPRAFIPDLDPTTVSGSLLAGDLRPAVEAIAAEGDVATLFRATGGKIEPGLLVQLADTSDPAEVTRILFDAIGTGAARINRAFTFDGRLPLVRGTWMRRALADTAPPTLRLDDPTGFMVGLDDYLKNARVSDDMSSVLLRRAAEAETHLDRVNVLEDSLDVIRQELVLRGVDEASARSLTQHVIGEGRDHRLFYVTATGENSMALPSMVRYSVDGKVEAIPRAHLVTEMAPEWVTLPKPREIKRLTSALQRVGPVLDRLHVPDALADWMSPIRTTRETGKLSGATLEAGSWQNLGRAVEFADYMSRAVWKPTTLLRPAWLVRQVIMDEGILRAGSTGMPSIFRHPVTWFAAMLDEGTEKAILKAGLDQPNGAFRASQEYQNALMDMGILDPVEARRIATDRWYTIDHSDPDFVEAWGRELGQMAGDPSRIMPRLAAGESVDDIVEALLHGDLATWRRSIGRQPVHAEQMASEAGVRQWVESLWERMRVKTGDNPTLMQAIADGYLQGSDEALYFSAPGSTAPTNGFHDLLATFRDEWAPQRVKHEPRIEARTRGAGFREALDTATRKAFNMLAAAPSNKLNRSPAWMFSYFDSLVDQMPLLTREAQDAVLAQAAKYRVASGWSFEIGDRVISTGDELLRRLQAATRNAEGRVVGPRLFDDAEHVAKFEAMERVQEVFGNLVTKNQTFDAMRILMPFAPAWREAMGSYARIIRDNPLILRRPAQAVQTGMESGFFYNDPSNGETMFAYPGSAWLMEHTPIGRAAPFPLTGRVRGLTMGLEVMPGLGPVATWPLAQIIPDVPAWDGVRNILIPFGAEGGREFLVPEWLEKLSVAMSNAQGDGPVAAAAHDLGDLLGGNTRESVGAWASSVDDVANYLASTGDYDLSSDAEVDRLMRDARERAVNLWIWRGVVQTTAPSAPRWNAVILNAGGDAVVAAAALDRLQQLRQEDPLHATQKFLDEFGELAFGLLSPKTESNSIYTPYDEAGYDWMREHDDVVGRYPEVGTLFAPTGGGPAGITAYIRRVESGDVTPIDPREGLLNGQDALASMLYAQAREQAEAAAAEAGYTSIPEPLQDWLRGERERLIQTYPGYLRDGRTSRDIETTIEQLTEALGEDELASTEAGRGIAEYLDLRAQALAEIQRSATADSLEAQAAAPLRAWLYAEGERLVGQYPSFANAWQRVFAREVELAEEG